MWFHLLALVSGQPDHSAFEAAYAAQAAASHTLATASDARAAASEVGAQGLAEQAAEFANDAKRDSIHAADTAPTAQLAVDEGAAQVERAGLAVKQAVAAAGTAKVLSESAAGKGAARGDKDTHAALGEVFKKFEDWRFSVLHNPEREARIHSEKASEPYIDALAKTEKRIEDLQQRAQALSGQAGSLRNIAVGTANLAVAKQAAVDLKGAQADMMTAHHQMAQANDFDSQAGKLQLQAQGLQLNVGGYQAAAQMATSYTGWRYNPDGRPPPPVPTFGFTPPPPPTGLALLQGAQVQGTPQPGPLLKRK
jgi:hypothetical protein